jgi:hypothetical protein
MDLWTCSSASICFGHDVSYAVLRPFTLTPRQILLVVHSWMRDGTFTSLSTAYREVDALCICTIMNIENTPLPYSSSTSANTVVHIIVVFVE